MRAAPIALVRTAIALATAVTLVALAGCGGGADTKPNPPSQPSDTTAPTAPTSLEATAAANRIDLSWAASTDEVGVTGYRVYRDGATEALATVTTTSYADTSVAPGTTYSYAVLAFDAAGNESALSASAAATTPGTAPQTSGLDARPSNTSCLAWARTSSSTEISLERFTSLTFSSPIGLLQAPADDSHWYVVQQNGVIERFAGSAPSTTSRFVNLSVRSGGEMGLLGMAFHPDFPQDSRVFLSYTTGRDPLVSRISAFTSNDQGATLDPDSEQILLTINQPEENHNGGHIAFGPDGYLYIGIGDGGGSGDDHDDTGNGQRLTTMLGKMLRIDVDSGSPYGIPSSNPFASNARCPPEGRASGECPEIYAWGLRNPWRWSFDRSNGDLWVADVGQGAYEEVNQVTLGGNYGWRCREGFHDFASGRTPGCSSASFEDPVTEYGRGLGQSITGGFVYRGSQPTGLLGRYVFGDFGSGRIFAWVPENTTAHEPTVLLESGLNISSFGQGNDGELYVVSYGGTLYRIVFEGSAEIDIPESLSDTGCVSTSDPEQPASGLIPYRVNAPFWSDGADKERWLALPNNQRIAVASGDDWDLPAGSVLMKHFRIGSRLIETRLLMRHPDGEWGGVTYEWSDDQTDATLVRGGAERDIGIAAPWIFPSETQCLECHTSAAGRSLGLETAQLNSTHLYPATGRTANQLATLSHVGALTQPIEDPDAEPSFADPYDTSVPLTERARVYLHTNCSFCHRPGGPTPSAMDLRYSTSLAETQACDAAPQSGDLGLGADARLIAPGSAENSVLLNRMNRRDEHAMPPIGSNQIDTAGVALITEWVDGLSGC